MLSFRYVSSWKEGQGKSCQKAKKQERQPAGGRWQQSDENQEKGSDITAGEFISPYGYADWLCLGCLLLPGGSTWKLTFFPPQADENVSAVQQWPEIQILTIEADQEAAIDIKPDGEVTDRIFFFSIIFYILTEQADIYLLLCSSCWDHAGRQNRGKRDCVSWR